MSTLTEATPEQRAEARRDPWQWLHDSGFGWDDVNAIASILAHVGLDIRPRTHDARCSTYVAHALYCPELTAAERDEAHTWMADHYEDVEA